MNFGWLLKLGCANSSRQIFRGVIIITLSPDNTFIELNRTFLRRGSEADYLYASRRGLQTDSSANWQDLLSKQLVVVLASAGTGKTEEFRNQARKLREKGDAAFFIAIEELADQAVEDVLSDCDSKLLESWRQDASKAYFFLDSVDEAKLKSKSGFGRALRKLRKFLGDHAYRGHFFVSSRPSDWDDDTDPKLVIDTLNLLDDRQSALDKDGEEFRDIDPDAELIGPVLNHYEFSDRTIATEDATDEAPDDAREKIEVWVLADLDDDQQAVFVHQACKGIEPIAFAAEVKKHGLEPYAKRPGDLRNLAIYWQNNGKFASLAKMTEAGIRRYLLEEKSHRTDGAVLSEDEAFWGAKRLAAALVLCKRLSILAPGHSISSHDKEDVIQPELILPDWSSQQRETLLRRGLFMPASFGKIRFQHRSSFEFLAARWLQDQMADERLEPVVHQLIFPEIFGVPTATPELRPVLAWLSLWNHRVQENLLQREPLELIRHGDPRSFSLEFRIRLLKSFTALEREGNVANLDVEQRAIWTFSSHELADAIREAWETTSYWQTKVLLLGMIAEAGIRQCGDLATEAAQTLDCGRSLIHDGLECLLAIQNKKGLKACASKLVNGGYGDDPEDLAMIASELYPAYIDTTELLGVVSLAKSPERYGYSGFGPRLSTFFGACPAGQRNTLLRGIGDLTLMKPFDTEYRRVSERYGLLAIYCAQLAETAFDNLAPSDPIDGLVRVLMASERAEERGDSRKRKKSLSEDVNERQDIKKALFWADVEETQEHETYEKLQERPWVGLHVSFGPPLWRLNETDIDWLLAGAQDTAHSEGAQLIAFYASLELASHNNQLHERIGDFSKLAEGRPVWHKWFQEIQKPRKKPEWEKIEEKRKREGKRKRLKKQGEAVATWRSYKCALQKNMPFPDFSDGFTGESWLLMVNLTKWLSLKASTHEEKTPRTWKALVPAFGVKIAESYRDHFKVFWRWMKAERPKWDGPSCTTKYTTNFAFAGIGIEADESPDWASRLSEHDARRASEHLVRSDEGIPDWMPALLDNHPTILIPLIRNEFKRQWTSTNELPRGWIDAFARGEGSIDEDLAAPIFSVITKNAPARNDRWDQGLKILQRMELTPLRWKKLETIAKEKTVDKATDLTDRLRFWAVLCMRDINSAVASIETFLSSANRETAEAVIGGLFDEFHEKGLAVQSLRNASVATLERLIHLVHQVIRPEDDIEHEGCFTPGRRDYAERGRWTILKALLDHPSREAYEAARRLSQHPELTIDEHMLKTFSKRMVESAASHPAWNEADVVAFERTRELPVKTPRQFFELMHSVALSIPRDFNLEDASSKELLKLGTDEELIQNWLAEQFQLRANGRYHRVREAQVYQGKKPDLILAASSANIQVAVEVKHGDKGYSVRDLRQAIERQLVGRYLKPDYRRGGLFVVTRHEKSHWIRPEDRKRISFEELIEDLNEVAVEIVRNHSITIRLGVVGIDAKGN